MPFLILGLMLFIGTHIAISKRRFRAKMIARWGAAKWKLALSTTSLIGLVLIAYGFGQYRAHGVTTLYDPPLLLRNMALILNLPVFVLLAAAYLPGWIKSTFRNPMLVAIGIWAVAHLFAKGDLGSILVFGSFLAWAVYGYVTLKTRELTEPRAETDGPLRNDLIAILIGLVFYLLVVKWLHFALIGVQPL